MSQPQSSRDMSTLVGTSKTLERAISGLLMSSKRLAELVSEKNKDHPTESLTGLVTALNKLSTNDRAVVDAILSHRGTVKRNHK